MKRTILLIVASGLITHASHAQISAGRIQIGGSISANHVKVNATPFQPEYKSSSVFVSPSLGWFYKTNKLTGVYLDFGYTEMNEQTNPRISRSYGGGIFFRQYQPVLNKLYIFLHESGGYNYVSETNNGFNRSNYNIGVSLQAGMAYDITRNMQLELSLNRLVTAYYQNGQGPESYSISTSLEKDVLSNVGFGFRYFLK